MVSTSCFGSSNIFKSKLPISINSIYSKASSKASFLPMIYRDLSRRSKENVLITEIMTKHMVIGINDKPIERID